ncbi:hypothetical protein POZ87_19775 [Cupriavidus taiwanensis]
MAGTQVRPAPFPPTPPTMPAAPDPSAAPAMPPCERCLALADDPRRREPPACLALRGTAPVVTQSAAGVPYSMLSFCCRDCGTGWRLYDRANELFVSWVPERPLER